MMGEQYSYGITTQEAMDAFSELARIEQAYMREHHPEAFRRDGRLRKDWLLVIYGAQLPWWRRFWLRLSLLR